MSAFGGGDSGADRDALDQPNLRRRVVAGILDLRQRGAKGVDKLPAVVTVRIAVGDGSVSVVESFINDRDFDAEVESDLLNRLVGIQEDALPVRLYEVEAAEKSVVTVEESTGGTLAWLEIDGGDRHGTWYAFKSAQTECRIGRGAWHGNDELRPNDVVASEADRFVSRRAAVLRRAGSGLEVEARDQGGYLVVVTDDGRRIRPTHVRSGAVRVRPGDLIELSDGEAQAVRIRLHNQRGPS